MERLERGTNRLRGRHERLLPHQWRGPGEISRLALSRGRSFATLSRDDVYGRAAPAHVVRGLAAPRRGTEPDPTMSEEDTTIRCARCEREDVHSMGTPPFPNELGERVAREICGDCWEEWKHHQMLLINHYGLNLRDANARRFLTQNMRSFLFSEGPAGAEIDTSREGEVSW